MRNPKIQSIDMIDFYQAYYNDSEAAFRTRCVDIVKNARAPNHTLLNQMQKMSKDSLLVAVSNFAMKGHGMGAL